jgi:hypothetical protein
MFKPAKTCYALHRAATVIGSNSELTSEIMNRIHNWQDSLDGGAGPQYGLYRATKVQKTRGHISMPPVGFKLTIPVSERLKAVRT